MEEALHRAVEMSKYARDSSKRGRRRFRKVSSRQVSAMRSYGSSQANGRKFASDRLTMYVPADAHLRTTMFVATVAVIRRHDLAIAHLRTTTFVISLGIIVMTRRYELAVAHLRAATLAELLVIIVMTHRHGLAVAHLWIDTFVGPLIAAMIRRLALAAAHLKTTTLARPLVIIAITLPRTRRRSSVNNDARLTTRHRNDSPLRTRRSSPSDDDVRQSTTTHLRMTAIVGP